MTDLALVKKTVKFFVSEQLKYPGLLAGMVLTQPLALLTLTFLPALLVADILEKLSSKDFIEGDLWGSFGLLIVFAIAIRTLGAVVVWRITVYFNWKLEGYVLRNISRKVFDHLMSQSSAFHANNFGGSLVSQATKLNGAYIRFTDTTLFHLLGIFWSLVLASIILVGRAPLFVLLLIMVSTLFMYLSAAATKKVRQLNKIQADVENVEKGHLADAITNVMAVKSFAAGPTESEEYAQATEKTRLATMDLMHTTLQRDALFGGVNTLVYALSIVLAVGGAVLFDANIATAFLIITYTADISQHLWDFSTQAMRNYNRAFGDAQGMIQKLAIEPEVKDPSSPEKLLIKHGEVQFRNVDFTHADSKVDETLFKNLNLNIKAGEKVGLVGHSGSGKTTLTKLLLRFNDIDGGGIFIDGQNISSITQDDLRSSIAYVPQEPMLFHRSISENIAYGKPTAKKTEITAAARKAHAIEFIEKLPNSYSTLVGERGVKLSGGQRQRIAIARAIIKDAPILVLDEATSALDSESEKLIQDALWELMQNRTAIVIAHRLSTIQRMDRIVVLDHGKIVEQGTHEALLRQKNGIYARLWARQSGGFLE